MLHVVLFEPEIPPNTGNIIRLCANTGCRLHLIEPLGFRLDDKQLRRAGLDYHEYANLQVHPSWSACAEHFTGARIFACTTKGQQRYDQVFYQAGDVLLFGPESRGLPLEVREKVPAAQRIYLPMCPQNRSLNLSNAVSVMVYEAWRQLDFTGSLVKN